MIKVPWKHAFYVGGFLAALCGVLGLVIAGGDLLTRNTIAANKVKKEQDGLRKVYGDNAEFSEAVEVKDDVYASIGKYWTVKIQGDEVGRVYSTSGTNSYGTVSLLVGVNKNYSLGNIVVLENTESYAATLEEKYLDVYKNAEDKESVVDNVKCGATFGASMCRDMIKAAQNHYKGGDAK